MNPKRMEIRRLWRRRSLVAAIGAVAVAALVFVLVHGRSGAADIDAAPGVAEADSQAMSGMAGMDMEAMARAMDGSVRLTADQLQSFGVTFGSVERRMLERRVRASGIVTFDETRLSEIVPKFSGYVEQLHVNFTGQPVRAGEPLAEVYSPELLAAQQELLLAARVADGLSSDSISDLVGSDIDLVDSARRRLRNLGVSNAQIDSVQRSSEPRRTLTLRAPVSGVVIEKPVVLGEAFESGQPLYRIADLSEVWIEAELREVDAGAAIEGSEAEVELAAFPGRPLTARVEYLHPVLETDARTLRARVSLPNPEGRIRPGMYASVILSSSSQETLTVPAAAIIDTGERTLVFVDSGMGTLIPQEVIVGQTSGDLAEILAGAEPGQRVVTSAQYLLESESRIADIMRSMIGSMGVSDMGNMDMSGGGMPDMEMPGMDTPPAAPSGQGGQ